MNTGFEKTKEQRRRSVWSALEFWMILRSDEEIEFWELDYFHSFSIAFSIHVFTSEFQTFFFKLFNIIGINFIPMSVSFGYVLLTIELVC